LTRDAEALRSRIDQDRHDTSAARAALEIALHEREHEADKQRQLLAANERDIESLRQQVAERDWTAAEAQRELEQQRQQVLEHERALAERQEHLRELALGLAERDRRLAALAAELDDARMTATSQGREIDSLRETLQYAQRELEQARSALAANEAELQSLRGALGAGARELDELRAAKEQLEPALAAAEAVAAGAAADLESAREQIAGLETELKDEREHAESLGELANERREHMTKLQEQVEEAEERYADANWRLGKSLHFERIVKRRKGLILKLLEALRAKMKANVALKAGIDGLRTFKQTAEMNQHKLLQRIDGLKAELKEAEETIKKHQGATVTKEELATAVARATTLEERLNTQAELIQSLESDLKTARLAAKPPQEHSDDLARDMKELGSKNEIIARLQADVDDLQRKLAKLRGSDSESVRLKAMTEKDRGEIDTLQREIARLHEMLSQQNDVAVAAAASRNADLETKLKERESSLTRLMGTIKEHEATIKKLTESAESWKRKYQFLATDQPDAYKHQAPK
jgi:chromosome segregation ATPase